MTLIRLECGDMNRCVRAFVISVTEIQIYWWWLAILDTLTWINTWRSGWLLRLWFMMTIETRSRRIGYCYMQYMHMWYWSVLGEAVYWAAFWLVIIFMLLKITGKRLFYRNTLYNLIVHHIHGYCLLILFTVYTITDWLLLYCYRYCHRIVPTL